MTAALPAVAELLEIDREYRRQAREGALPLIAPRRFNPRHETWLPVFHTRRGDRKYTALFSNTAQAHRRGRTRDWVVLYFDAGEGEDQCTVVTEYHGPLRRRRVVRGRELECAEYYGVPVEPEGEVLWFTDAIRPSSRRTARSAR